MPALYDNAAFLTRIFRGAANGAACVSFLLSYDGINLHPDVGEQNSSKTRARCAPDSYEKANSTAIQEVVKRPRSRARARAVNPLAVAIVFTGEECGASRRHGAVKKKNGEPGSPYLSYLFD